LRERFDVLRDCLLHGAADVLHAHRRHAGRRRRKLRILRVEGTSLPARRVDALAVPLSVLLDSRRPPGTFVR
jgi:hypothetical protein